MGVSPRNTVETPLKMTNKCHLFKVLEMAQVTNKWMLLGLTNKESGANLEFGALGLTLSKLEMAANPNKRPEQEMFQYNFRSNI